MNNSSFFRPIACLVLASAAIAATSTPERVPFNADEFREPHDWTVRKSRGKSKGRCRSPGAFGGRARR